MITQYDMLIQTITFDRRAFQKIENNGISILNIDEMKKFASKCAED